MHGPMRNQGLELADSVTIDPHKWFHAPLDAGAILVKDDCRLTASFGMKPSYLTDELDRGNERYQYYVHSFEQSRRFRGLKDVRQPKRLYSVIAKHPDFEAASEPPMSAI
jgi:aromatic-L-amino-acid decarboxylase